MTTAHPLVRPAATTIALDHTAIQRRKLDKRRRYLSQQVPILRFIGFLILWSIVAFERTGVHDSWLTIAAVGAGFVIYCAGSWLVALVMPDRRLSMAARVFLVLDPFLWMVAVYLAGAEKSWLYTVVLVRVADQLNTNRRKALVFTGIGVLAYLSLLAYISLVDGRSIDWSNQLGRIAFLVGVGIYLSMTAGAAERLRDQLADAVRTARDSIRLLQAQSLELQDARTRAEAASHAKTQFLANISHEFRTPLNAIIGYAELLHEETDDAGKLRHEDIEHINRSARHLRGLINDVIELSRLEVGKVSLHVHSFSVASAVADATSTVLPLIRNNANTLNVRGADEAGDLVADAHKVRQILINLIGNATKFTSHGCVTVSCSREGARGNDHAAEIVIAVSDTGIGMTPEQLARIRAFEPFVQADGGIARRFGGTGLGLTISQRFAALMGGRLEIDSESGRGSTVTLRLPAVVPEHLLPDDLPLA